MLRVWRANEVCRCCVYGGRMRCVHAVQGSSLHVVRHSRYHDRKIGIKDGMATWVKLV